MQISAKGLYVWISPRPQRVFILNDVYAFCICILTQHRDNGNTKLLCVFYPNNSKRSDLLRRGSRAFANPTRFVIVYRSKCVAFSLTAVFGFYIHLARPFSATGAVTTRIETGLISCALITLYYATTHVCSYTCVRKRLACFVYFSVISDFNLYIAVGLHARGR